MSLAKINAQHKARVALEAVSRIDTLFAIEREINGLSSDERERVRHERSRPLVEALETWLREQYTRLSPNSQVAKAIAYSLKAAASSTTVSVALPGHLQMSPNLPLTKSTHSLQQVLTGNSRYVSRRQLTINLAAAKAAPHRRHALVHQTVSEHEAAQAAQRHDRLTRASHRPKVRKI
jgi:hypothetical protein